MPSSGSSAVASLAEARARRDGTAGLLACPCGSQWFDAKVCIENGRVTGYAVPVLCVSCGEEVVPS